MVSTGFFADKAISMIALPDFDRGSHVIEIQLSYTRETSVEWFYLLGDFGVVLEGTRAVVTEPVHKLGFGDWLHQGLPFYGGNVTYHCTSPSDGNVIQIPQYRATTIRVSSGGESCSIYRQPHMADLPLKQGKNLDITLFGHRANCFGPVHLAEPMEWLGPNAWRVVGSRFSPEYQLKPLGLMSAPIVLWKCSIE